MPHVCAGEGLVFAVRQLFQKYSLFQGGIRAVESLEGQLSSVLAPFSLWASATSYIPVAEFMEASKPRMIWFFTRNDRPPIELYVEPAVLGDDAQGCQCDFNIFMVQIEL